MGDSLRSVAGWFVVGLMLLLRKANRVKEAWALLLPLAVLYLVLDVAERQLNAYLVFHYHQYICSALADLLRYFALSLAILLAIADRLDIPWHPVRSILVFLLLGLCADVQIELNGWPVMDSGRWAVVFAVILLVFTVGHSLVHAVFRRCFKPARFRWWYSGFCLVFGLAPMLALGAVQAHLSRSVQLSSTLEQYRIVVVLASAITLPYLLFFPFILLALSCPLYCERFARAFGVTSLDREPKARQPESAPIPVEARIP
jgi:hypothetical protein